jgi:hypothetical protein
MLEIKIISFEEKMEGNVMIMRYINVSATTF